MKEIKLNIPEGCKAITVKVDGENVITEFEPKEKKWEPQDGDFLTDMTDGTVVIYKSTQEYGGIVTYAGYLHGFGYENLTTETSPGWGFTRNYRPATGEEKAKLLGRLKKEDYIWNPDKKELERLPRWRADKDEVYYFVDTYGDTDYTEEDNCNVDDKRYEMGNYFRTRKAAELVAEQIREIFKNSKAE